MITVKKYRFLSRCNKCQTQWISCKSYFWFFDDTISLVVFSLFLISNSMAMMCLDLFFFVSPNGSYHFLDLWLDDGGFHMFWKIFNNFSSSIASISFLIPPLGPVVWRISELSLFPNYFLNSLFVFFHLFSPCLIWIFFSPVFHFTDFPLSFL